jgi:flagellar biosynthesis GTPase FlhF
MEKIRDKVLAKINSLEHRDLKKGTFHKAIADYTQTLFEAQQKEIERLKQEVKTFKDLYKKQRADKYKLIDENTQLKKQLKVLEELNDKFKAQRDKAEQQLKV